VAALTLGQVRARPAMLVMGRRAAHRRCRRAGRRSGSGRRAASAGRAGVRPDRPERPASSPTRRAIGGRSGRSVS